MKRSNSNTAPRRRLNRADWLNAGLRILLENGIGALTVDRMADALEISRGSFYHNFESREDLLTAMLDYWVEEWTNKVAVSVIELGLPAEIALPALSRVIRSRRAAEYDAPVRAWAMSDPLAVRYVRDADARRVEFAKSLYSSLGFNDLQVECRARMFLYYEAFAPMMFEGPDEAKADELIDMRHAILARRDDPPEA
jgi:AcrR family transcriptional regulator